MIAEGLGIRSALFGAVQMGVVKIAERHHLDVGVPEEIAHVARAAIADADYAEPDLLIRSHDPGIRKGRGDRGAAEKAAAVELIVEHRLIVEPCKPIA